MGAMGTLVGVAMLAPVGTMSTLFGTASAPEFLHLEPLPGLPLLAPFGNLCPRGITSQLIGAAGLAPSGVTSMPFGTTGVLEMRRPEPPSTPEWLGSPNISEWPEPPGMSMWLDMPCQSGQPEYGYAALAVLLAPSGVYCGRSYALEVSGCEWYEDDGPHLADHCGVPPPCHGVEVLART